MSAVAISFALLLTQLSQGAVANNQPYGMGDLKIPAVYGLGPCGNAPELDCIDSVSLIDKSAGEISAEYLGYQANPIQQPSALDPNLKVLGESTWRVTGTQLRLMVILETPENILLTNSNGPQQKGAALRGFVTVANPLQTRVRVKVRTSWLKPMNVQIKMMDAEFAQTKIEGGNLWTFEGSAIESSDYSGDVNTRNSKKAVDARADIDATEFSFIVHHAGVDAKSSYWPPICADKGYTVQSHNTNETGDPYWNPVDKTLEFAIFAPHLRADGRKNLGYFRLWTTHEFLNCKFPENDLTSAPRLQVQILYDDGSTGVATTSVNNANGRLDFRAAGFHFSSPKIVIKRDPSFVEPKPESTQAPTVIAVAPTVVADSPKIDTAIREEPKVVVSEKKPVTVKRVLCVKGKKRVLLKAGSTKCPTGFKKT